MKDPSASSIVRHRASVSIFNEVWTSVCWADVCTCSARWGQYITAWILHEHAEEDPAWGEVGMKPKVCFEASSRVTADISRNSEMAPADPFYIRSGCDSQLQILCVSVSLCHFFQNVAFPYQTSAVRKWNVSCLCAHPALLHRTETSSWGHSEDLDSCLWDIPPDE